MPRVVLFKTPSTTTGTDTYDETFTRAGFVVTHIPVLEETFHVDDLTRLLLDKEGSWSGVVITSKRGAEGWVKAVQNCESVLPTNWTDVQLYTVGSSSLDYLSSNNPTLPRKLRLDTTRAIQAKSATMLLPLILETSNTDNRPLLVIRGDKSTNELQDGLQESKRFYIEIVVYSTTCRQSLEADVESLMPSVKGDGEIAEDTWLVFFSPSSAEMVLDRIRAVALDSKNGWRENEIWAKVRIGAIGETTGQFLFAHGLNVQAVAKEPTAEGLVSAIQASYGNTKPC